MKKILGVTLGIMTALGGFVDLGQIVFTTQAGALFGYQLMWAIALGTAAIIIYMEMCGRVAVVAKEPVFAVVHTRLGKKLGLAALIASNLLNLITCAAEIGHDGASFSFSMAREDAWSVWPDDDRLCRVRGDASSGLGSAGPWPYPEGLGTGYQTYSSVLVLCGWYF